MQILLEEIRDSLHQLSMVEHKIAMAADASEQLHAFEALKDRASVIYSSLNSSKEVFVQRIYFLIITSRGWTDCSRDSLKVTP